MRYLLLVFAVAGLVSCGKGKYDTVPQITYKTVTPVFYQNTVGLPTDGPKLTLEVTDADGDFGRTLTDTSWIYIRNVSIPPYKIDSFQFPEAVTNVVKKNFKASVEVALAGDGTPGHNGVLASTNQAHHTDTLFFEIYVQDLGKHKSNIVRSTDPLLYVNP